MAKRGYFTLTQTVEPEAVYKGLDLSIDVERECSWELSHEEWGWDFDVTGDERTILSVTVWYPEGKRTYRPDECEPELRAVAWAEVDKYCDANDAEPPEEDPRQRGDDDGVEYGHPSEYGRW